MDYLGIELSSEEFSLLCEEKNKAYVEALDVLNSDYILPGISDFIVALRKHGIKMALASASKNGPMILQKLGLLAAFDAIANPAKIALGKPAPDIFLAAAEELGLRPSDCIAVEDAVAGVTAINAAGIISIAVGGEELNHAAKRFDSTEDLSFQAVKEFWDSLKTP